MVAGHTLDGNKENDRTRQQRWRVAAVERWRWRERCVCAREKEREGERVWERGMRAGGMGASGREWMRVVLCGVKATTEDVVVEHICALLQSAACSCTNIKPPAHAAWWPHIFFRFSRASSHAIHSPFFIQSLCAAEHKHRGPAASSHTVLQRKLIPDTQTLL